MVLHSCKRNKAWAEIVQMGRLVMAILDEERTQAFDHMQLIVITRSVSPASAVPDE